MFNLDKVQYKSVSETLFLPIGLAVMKRLIKCNIGVKIPTQNGKKIFVNHISDKGLVSRMYKELKKLTSEKITQMVSCH